MQFCAFEIDRFEENHDRMSSTLEPRKLRMASKSKNVMLFSSICNFKETIAVVIGIKMFKGGLEYWFRFKSMYRVQKPHI